MKNPDRAAYILIRAQRDGYLPSEVFDRILEGLQGKVKLDPSEPAFRWLVTAEILSTLKPTEGKL